MSTKKMLNNYSGSWFKIITNNNVTKEQFMLSLGDVNGIKKYSSIVCANDSMRFSVLVNETCVQIQHNSNVK